MLRAVADRSTRVRQRQEKLCRRWLTDAYGGRPMMKMALNEGDVVHGLRSADRQSSSARYEGAASCKHLYT